jgi:anhydro-N-acetylmuramic acid kinase
LPAVLDELDAQNYYNLLPPKSLSNEAVRDLVFPSLLESDYSVPDRMHTATVHIARQIARAVRQFPAGREHASLLVTGGGAFNTFLVERIRQLLAPGIEVVVPDAATVKYKEAIAMALIGTLRWREDANVLSSVTGSSKDSVGGALWMG